MIPRVPRENSQPIAARWRVRVLLTFAAWLAVTGFVYRDTASNFLRAESGWYLSLSHSPSVIQRDFVRRVMTESFNGHYAPLAFLAEFETAKIAGTAATFWKWRQIALVALVATAIHQVTRQASRLLTRNSKQNWTAPAAAIAALIVFQPNMKDFVAWPFMCMQLFWLLLTLLTLAALLKVAEAPDRVYWRWLSVGAAYGSLHFLGLGLATVAATATLLAVDLVWQWRAKLPRKSALPLVTLILVTVVHATVMLKFIRSEIPVAGPPWGATAFVKAALAFMPNFAMAAIRGLFGLAQPWVDPSWMRAQWPYGCGFLVLALGVVAAVIYRYRPNASERGRAQLTLVVFSTVSFLAIAALIAARQLHDPSLRGFSDFLIGSRYVLPANSAFLGLMIVFVVAGTRQVWPRVRTVAAGLLVLAVALGQIEYSRHIYSKILPLSIISHEAAWRSVVIMSRQCRDAALPIPNVPLERLAQDFPGWDLKNLAPLLRAELGVTDGVPLQFTDWNQFSANVPQEYGQHVPAIRDVVRNVGLPALSAGPRPGS